MTNEKRKYVRILFKSGVRIELQGKWIETKVSDLSLKGLLVEWPFEEELEEGRYYPIELPLHENERNPAIRMEAAVAHRQDGKVGFSWKKIDGESLAHLRTLLSYNIGDSEQVEKELYNLVEDVRREAAENGDTA